MRQVFSSLMGPADEIEGRSEILTSSTFHCLIQFYLCQNKKVSDFYKKPCKCALYLKCSFHVILDAKHKYQKNLHQNRHHSSQHDDLLINGFFFIKSCSFCTENFEVHSLKKTIHHELIMKVNSRMWSVFIMTQTVLLLHLPFFRQIYY